MMTLEVRRKTSVIVVSTDALPTRTDDLRFLVLDQLRDLHLSDLEVPIPASLAVKVVERDAAVAKVEARYAVGVLPRDISDSATGPLMKQIRDVGVERLQNLDFYTVDIG